MKNKETVEALNMLIQINNNRIEGYGTASIHNKDEDTKNILFQLMETCKNCKTELVSEILQLGGIPSKGTKAGFSSYWSPQEMHFVKIFKKQLLIHVLMASVLQLTNIVKY
ncbi:MAG: DUF2383 domain-containing protein [Sphingobacteriaceae bacterium]|nr:DUF2383 domain-containing protein [Sphingobacteriaceae bacterium]